MTHLSNRTSAAHVYLSVAAFFLSPFLFALTARAQNTITTVAGGGAAEPVAVDKSARLLIADTNNGRVRDLTPDPTWQQVPGLLSQLAVGSDGTVWGLNSAGQIYMFNPQTQTWQQAPGLLTRVVVGSSGFVWGLNAYGQIYRYDPAIQSWDHIPGILSQIAVGSDGDVWGINPSNQVYHFNSATQTWSQIAGALALAQIAVGYDGAVWGINAAQQIYRFNPGTQSWQQIPGALKRVAVGADGDVWGINNVGQTYHFNTLTQRWDNAPGSLAQIAVGSASNVWGIDATGAIWRFNAQAQAWNQIPGQLAQIGVAANGAVWGLNSGDQIYQFVQTAPPTQTFHHIPGSLAQIAAGIDGEVWGIDAAQRIWRYDAQLQSWQQIPGALSEIRVGFGGNVWGLNALGQIYQFNPSTQGWSQIPGALAQLAVGANGSVWGLNAAGQIYQFNASTQGWNKIPGALAQLAVGADGTVWGLNSVGQIYRFNPATQGWVQIPGGLAQIAVGSANNVWGLNAAGQVWRYDPLLQKWDSIAGVLTSLAVAFDGTVWGLNSANQIWRFNAQTQSWNSIPGGLSQVSVAADAVVWGLNAKDETYEYTGAPGTITTALSVTTTSLPSGVVGTAYSTTLVATGGTTPYTWSISSGTLPAGLSLAASTGVISGTPTAAGTSNFSVEVTDSGGPAQTASQSLTLVINPLTVPLTPGTPATSTLPANSTTTLNFSFPANAVTQAVTATLTAVASGNLPLALPSGTTFVAAFDLTVNPPISSFGAAVGLSGSVSPAIASGTTLQLAMYQDPPAASSPAARARLRRTALQPMTTGPQWIVVSTLVVGLNGSLTQNLATTDLPGIVAPGEYVLFIPAPGTTIVSNFGVVLMGDDSMGTGNCAEALQVIHLYDTYGNPLATPTIDCLSYSGAYDLDGTALTPDGSQGVLVDGGNTVRFFSRLQTGVVTASTTTLDVSNYGGDGDSIAIMPNGDEAVVSADGDCPSAAPCLLLVSGIVSGNPTPAITITLPDYRDGVVISNDGQELLARGYGGLTVFAIAPVTPYTGSEGGTASHSFTQIIDLPALGSDMEDGRDGMAISPVDSSRALVLLSDGSIQLLTGLPSTPTLGPTITPSVSYPMSVSITPDGKTAIVGGFEGVSMISGVDTGTLAEVGSVYSPSYTAYGGTVSLTLVTTLAITLDGKYVAVCDLENSALLVIPITSSGFGAPVGVITGLAVPSNDQLVVH